MKYKKYPYPIQLTSIKKNQWRLQKFIDLGLNIEQLQEKELEIWQKIKYIADNAQKPLAIFSLYPESKLIGYGWEWAVYELPNKKEVIKIPAGIFKEINELEYLENVKYAYGVCKKKLGDFVVDTTFQRIKYKETNINILRQRKIIGNEVNLIEIEKTNQQLKESLIKLTQGMLSILKEYDWMPDIHLQPQKNGWNIWNLIIEKNKPILFDFSIYYDVWRLYPQRTKEEIKIKTKYWKDFLKQLS